MSTRLPPGPTLPALTQTWRYWRSPAEFVRRCHEQFGARFTVRLWPFGTVVVLADPGDVKALVRSDPSVFQAGRANSFGEMVLGRESVFVIDDEEHARTRALMMPAFHGKAVRDQVELMREITAANLASWPVGEPVQALPQMQAISLEVISRNVMGIDDSALKEKVQEAVLRLLRTGSVFDVLPGHDRFPSLHPGRLKRRRMRARADALLREQIAAHRADPRLDERTDVLAMLLRASEAEGGWMSDANICDQLITLLLAGHETTATGLAWCLERLVRHPEVLAEAQRAADTDDDTYLDAVIKEALRCRPVVPDVGRKLARDADFAGYRLPKGTSLWPSIELLHTSAESFPDPGAFRPERFLERGSMADWVPFGIGNRRCLGATFAQVESRVVLRELLRHFEFETTDAPGEAAKARHVTQVPVGFATVTVRRRDAA
ncbi:cytochrome P450 [Saccharopolyspora sp. TS4A08]|uniref:Cytochrome P450 n=1 Tax=Saccharopolyspora ipomoeae TaxID=3042027 RepID=A0ABT6PTS0_9PSEU|nr:cytochrome P450 [Saccharopolyspora sp. TS4A08]MDI2031398.1 cytochrome P450 [Saccharopolyspora sp. TS4A08]